MKPSITSGRLSMVTLAALSGPNIFLAALGLPLVIFLPEYYSGPLGLDIAYVGMIFMIVRLADIVFDPLIGAMMDRAENNPMRYRLWMIGGAPLIMLGMAMLFMATPEDNIGPLYLPFWLILAYAGWSIVSLAQLALAANVSPDYNERSRIYSWLQVAFLIGLLGVTLAPRYMTSGGAQTASQAMTAMAWVVVAITPFLVLGTVLLVRERPAETSGDHTHSNVKEYLKMFKLGVVRRIILIELLYGLAAGVASTLLLFFFTRAKGIDRLDVAIILIVHFLTALVGTPVWTHLAQRIEKHKALALAGVFYAACQTMMIFVPQGGLIYAASLAGMTGTVLGVVTLLPRAMMADVADEVNLSTGADRTGVLFAILIGTWKVGQALSVGIMFVALGMIGFNADPGSQNEPYAIYSLIGLYAAGPSLLCLIGAWLAWKHPLTESRHKEIRAALDARTQAAPAAAAP